MSGGPPARHHGRMSSASGTLTRPRQGRVIAGVCAGVARRFGWDLTLTRVLTVVAAFFAGSAVLIYIVLWIVVPEE